MTKDELMRAASANEPTKVETSIGTVYVRQATGADYDFIRRGPGGVGDDTQLAERLIVCCLCGEDGMPIFDRKDVDSISRTWTVKAIEAVARAVRDHCGAFDSGSDAGN